MCVGVGVGVGVGGCVGGCGCGWVCVIWFMLHIGWSQKIYVFMNNIYINIALDVNVLFYT